METFMSWVKVVLKKEALDKLLLEEIKTSDRHCGDCGVIPGEKHLDGCDIAECLVCRGQRLQCSCENGSGDIWTGLWPGTIECYEYGLTCRWKGPEPVKGWGKGFSFDHNSLHIMDTRKNRPPKLYLFKDFLKDFQKESLENPELKEYWDYLMGI